VSYVPSADCPTAGLSMVVEETHVAMAGHQNTALVHPDVVDAVEGVVPDGQHLTLQGCMFCEDEDRQRSIFCEDGKRQRSMFCENRRKAKTRILQNWGKAGNFAPACIAG